MRDAVDVVVQATLASDEWFGRAEILRRVPSSGLGAWSYEVIDTKLARETRAGTILQLCLYSDVVGEVQGRLPERMYVVAPGTAFEAESFRVNDYLAYIDWKTQRFADTATRDAGAPYVPGPRAAVRCVSVVIRL